MKRPRLNLQQILSWADAHYARTGRWPALNLGEMPEAPGEKWSAINSAMTHGLRGLRGSSSLARQLAKHRGVKDRRRRPRLTIKQILTWADAHHQRTGTWPMIRSGTVHGVRGETWCNVESALYVGLRGLPGGSSLAKCLAKRRGVRNQNDAPAHSIALILAWADDHHRRTGRWPRVLSGTVQAAPGETWIAVDTALTNGSRGLPGGSSVAKLLQRCRGVRNTKDLPGLPIKQIIAWADAHFERTGKWPTQKSGSVYGSRHETWRSLDQALRKGTRGLPSGSSLSKALDKYRRHVGLQ